MKTVEAMSYRVFSDDLSLIPIKESSCRVICTISPNSYGIATKDLEFDNALKTSDYLVLDGVYFGLASILLSGTRMRPNQGPQLFDHFIKRANKGSLRVFFLGSTESTLEKMKVNAQKLYPNLTVDCYSPPFKSTFSQDDNTLMIERVNSFNPDILFVGMTCPKQEKWAVANRDHLHAGIAICIGNVFDWFAGTQKSIPMVWYKLKLAWLIRIVLRPEILRRNIRNQMTFFFHLILVFLGLRPI